jgi:hypothetical protein
MKEESLVDTEFPAHVIVYVSSQGVASIFQSVGSVEDVLVRFEKQTYARMVSTVSVYRVSPTSGYLEFRGVFKAKPSRREFVLDDSSVQWESRG